MRRVNVEWCRGRGGTEGLCAVLIRLALPNRVPAVELVIIQPHCSRPSKISAPCNGQYDPLQEDQCLRHAWPAVRPAWLPVAILTVPQSAVGSVCPY